MTRYKCIKDFQVGICDGDGFSTGEKITIKVGSTWVDEGEKVISTGEVHLENLEGKYGWLEIYKEDLKESFEVIK